MITGSGRRARRTARVMPVRTEVRAPSPHPSGVRPPQLPPELVPRHVAIVMDGNGRWAKARGLPRTRGHEAGEAALFDVIEGAIELGVTHVSAYAFSTENWKRSPEEVRFFMGYNRDVISVAATARLRPTSLLQPPNPELPSARFAPTCIRPAYRLVFSG